MPHGDVRRVKNLAHRLGVHESEVIRFAVRAMLERLGPLCDEQVVGRKLVPVFVESGAELLRFFNLDNDRLNVIINGDADVQQRVEPEDIALLAMSSTQQPYAALKLSELQAADRSSATEPAELSTSLRQYLYDKYVFRQSAPRLNSAVVLELLGAAK
jgi:hypothetical protein